MTEMTTSDLTQCAENVRIGWGLMLSGQSRIEEGKKDYVEGVLKAAEAIVTARDALKNDAEFGKWCSDSGFSLKVIDKDNRAALIRIGRNVPYWRKRLAEIKTSQSLRYLIKDVPDEEVSLAAIPARHQTKPGPKPAEAQPTAVDQAEYDRLVEQGRKIVAETKRSAPQSDDDAEDAPSTPAAPLKGEPGFRSAKDVAKELKRTAKADGNSLVAKLLPLIDQVEEQSKRHVGLISTSSLLIAASGMRRLLADAATSDGIPWPPADQKAINAAAKIIAGHPREAAKLANVLVPLLQRTDSPVQFSPAQQKDIDAIIKDYKKRLYASFDNAVWDEAASESRRRPRSSPPASWSGRRRRRRLRTGHSGRNSIIARWPTRRRSSPKRSSTPSSFARAPTPHRRRATSPNSPSTPRSCG